MGESSKIESKMDFFPNIFHLLSLAPVCKYFLFQCNSSQLCGSGYVLFVGSAGTFCFDLIVLNYVDPDMFCLSVLQALLVLI